MEGFTREKTTGKFVARLFYADKHFCTSICIDSAFGSTQRCICLYR